MQNMYFANYLKIQGTMRELWLKEYVPNAMQHLAHGLTLSTKTAHCDYKKPFFLYDEILIRMHFEDLRRVSVKLVFEYYMKKTMKLCASGWQIVVFKDTNRKTCRMPEDFRKAMMGILWTSEEDLQRKN